MSWSQRPRQGAKQYESLPPVDQRPVLNSATSSQGPCESPTHQTQRWGSRRRRRRNAELQVVEVSLGLQMAIAMAVVAPALYLLRSGCLSERRRPARRRVGAGRRPLTRKRLQVVARTRMQGLSHQTFSGVTRWERRGGCTSPGGATPEAKVTSAEAAVAPRGGWCSTIRPARDRMLGTIRQIFCVGVDRRVAVCLVIEARQQRGLSQHGTPPQVSRMKDTGAFGLARKLYIYLRDEKQVQLASSACCKPLVLCSDGSSWRVNTTSALSLTFTAFVCFDFAGLQTILGHSKPQLREVQPNPFSSLDTILDAKAQDSASPMAGNSPGLFPPAQLGDDGTDTAVEERRSVAEKKDLTFDTRDGSDKPPPDKKANYGTGEEGHVLRKSKGGLSPVPPSASSPLTDSTVSGAGGRSEQAPTGTSPHHVLGPAAASPIPTERSGSRLEGARCPLWRLQTCTTRPPCIDVAATIAGGIGCCPASTLTPGANQGFPSLEPGPTQGPSVKDAGFAPVANDYPARTKSQTNPPESLPRSSGEINPNLYDTATEDAACVPGAVPSPYAGGVNPRVRAAPRRSSTGVSTAHGAVDRVARVHAQGVRVTAPVPNRYRASGTFSRAPAPTAGVPAGVPNPYHAIGTTSGFPPPPERVSAVVPSATEAMGTTLRVSSCADRISTGPPNSSRDPTLPATLGQPTERSPTVSTCSSDAPKAPTRREPAQNQLDGNASSSDGTSSETPPEVRFEVARQQLYGNPRSGTTRRGGRGRGRGRGRRGARVANRGGKLGSTAPRPAQDALVGVWRSKPAKKSGERGTR